MAPTRSGRNYCHHVLGFVWGIFDQPVHSWRGAMLAGVVEDENVYNPKRGFVGGYHLELATLDLPTLPLVGLPYGWGRDFASIIDNYRNMAGMLHQRRGPAARRQSHHALDHALKDAYGLPVAHVHCDEHANDMALRDHAQQQAKRIYEAVGAKRVVRSATPPATHNMGTARMSRGSRATASPILHGRTHDVPNLFISDGSVFSTPGAANPTLTIVALALRQAEFLAKEMAARNL